MKKLIPLIAFAIATLARDASAHINEFTVKLPPQLASLTYETPGFMGGDLGCSPDPNVCEFGLEMEMAFTIDELGLAQATVSQVEVHGNAAALIAHPEFHTYLVNSAKSLFESADFAVERGPGEYQTNLVGPALMGDALRLEFDRAKLISLSGGPDYRPVDGARLTFSYAVPEPSTIGLVIVTCATALGWYAANRFRRQPR